MAVLLLAGAPAIGAPTPGQLPGAAPGEHRVFERPAAFSPPFAAWEARGPVTPVTVPGAGGETVLRLRHNTTLAGPVITVPAGARALSIAAEAAGGMFLNVAAEDPATGRSTPLGTLRPLPSGTAMGVDVSRVAGRSVRLLVDPAGPFGATAGLIAVGPFSAPMPGWDVRGPLLGVGDGVEARDALVRLVSPLVRRPPGVAAFEVAYRGSGTMVLAAGAGRVTPRVVGGWSRVRVPMRPAGRVRLSIRLDARDGAIRLREVGRYVVAPRLSVRVRAARRGFVVAGSVRPRTLHGGEVQLRIGRRILRRTRTTATGRFVFAVPGIPARLMVVVSAGPGVLAARMPVRPAR